MKPNYFGTTFIRIPSDYVEYMEPNTLRLSSETWDDLAEEATKKGYRNRSEYMREIIEDRDVSCSNTIEYDDIQLDEILERLEQLEEEIDSGGGVVEKTEVEESSDDVIEEVISEWFPKQKREERREAARQALIFVRGRGRAEKKHFLDAVDRTVPDQNDDTFWRKSIRPGLQEAMEEGLVRHERGPPHEYVWVHTTR